MTTFRYQVTLLTAAIVGIVLSAAWLAYQPALSGTFLLDDVANLGGLQSIDDTASALHFVLSGTAGPVGRPLALASFLPQADQWEQGAAPFLAVNIAIHLLNGCLLGGFLYLLTRARGIGRAESRYVALAAMSLWLFMPLLASSSLMVVQRMTTMSATFVLLGLNGYLVARGWIERVPTRALWGMSAALAVATLLAVLTKESGALLPVLVLVIETTLLSPPRAMPVRKWRIWMAVFLGIPTAVLVGYIVTRLPYSEALALRREFTGWERLLTEAQILWEYLLNAFVPRPGHYGPFHDAYPVARGLIDPVTFIAVSGWLLAIVLATLRRKRYPLFAFAVLWFIAGHLLESTTIALELYFEHRNYLPVIGPVYALCNLAFSVPDRYRRIVRVTLPLYVLVNAFFLFGLTSLYGDPGYSTWYWHERFPSSSRATTALATRQLESEGPVATVETLNEFVARHPGHAYLGIPALSLSCIIAPEEHHGDHVEKLAGALPTIGFSFQVSDMLSDLLTTISRTDCRGVDVAVVESLARAVISNPRYGKSSGYQQLHHQILARIERQAGTAERTLEHLERAIAIKPSSDLNMMVITTLVSDGRFEEARNFLAEARRNLPMHPLRRYLWRQSLDELAAYVNKVEGISTHGG